MSKLDYVPNLPWDIPGWIWDMITFGTSIYPKSEVRFGMYEIRIPVWDIPKLIWDIGSVWATTAELMIKFSCRAILRIKILVVIWAYRQKFRDHMIFPPVMSHQ